MRVKRIGIKSSPDLRKEAREISEHNKGAAAEFSTHFLILSNCHNLESISTAIGPLFIKYLHFRRLCRPSPQSSPSHLGWALSRKNRSPLDALNPFPGRFTLLHKLLIFYLFSKNILTNPDPFHIFFCFSKKSVENHVIEK